VLRSTSLIRSGDVATQRLLPPQRVGRSFVYEQIRDGHITYEAEIAWRNALPKLTPGPVPRLNKTRPNPPSTRAA
jgi:hypothetical protein